MVDRWIRSGRHRSGGAPVYPFKEIGEAAYWSSSGERDRPSIGS